jgi:hypothetical protein
VAKFGIADVVNPANKLDLETFVSKALSYPPILEYILKGPVLAPAVVSVIVAVIAI